MFKSAERKKSQGFTLAEVLIVVAIIGILLAVAIPNVISYYRSLKLTELDDSARTIFVAAQNRLTAMKSAGANLYALSTVEVNEKPDPSVGTGRFLAVTSAQADSLASLVPGGSIESQLHDNHYVVEIDAKTGAVYAVWYWEKEDFDYTNESYDEVKPEKDKRLDAGRMVGYYGGSFIDRPNIGQTPMPSAQVINAEELALNITVRGDGFTGTPPSIKATITLINGGNRCEIISNSNLKYDPFNNVFTGRIALDTLDGSKYTLANNANSFESGNMGKPFKDWVCDTMALSYIIAPGANFDIEVKVTAVDTSGSSDPVNYLPQYLYWTDVNSLFASVEEDSVTGEPVTAKIAYGRHLQNLDSDTSDVTNTITAAEQTRNIDFNDSASVTGVYSWAETYGSMFKPIENASLTSYNGHEYEIRNLNIQKNTSDYLGLFGFLYLYNLDDTIKFEKIILVNTKSEEGIVGALVGGLGMNGSIDDCHVYLDEIGADGKLLDPSPRLKGSSVGGLVGMAFADLTMTNCSAATVISGTSYAGGLVSNVAGVCKISKSYAACNITGAYVGGLVGLGTGGVTIQNSYAAGTADVIDDASKDRKVAGLVNWAEGTVGALPPELTNSYAAVRYGKSVTDALASGSLTNFYGACEIKAGVTVSDLYYVKQTGITYATDSGEAVSMSELKNKIGTAPFDVTNGWYDPGTGTTVNPQGLTYPYNILNEGLADPYPYPMLASDITAVGGTDKLPMPHYGDWLENSYATSFYWEKEGTGYKFYLVLSNGTTQYIADNLCTEYHLNPATRTDVEAWGYGLIGIDADAVTDAGLTLGDSTVTNKADITTPLKSFLADTGTTWNGTKPVGPLEEITALLSDDSNVILLKGAEEDDFHAIETGAGYLELNLGFAAAIDVTKDTGTGAPSEATNMGKASAPYQIRTVRQLDNIPDTSATTNGVYYGQTHDINGTGYTAGTDGYKGATVFSGTYDGNSYRILELSTETGGLFVTITNAVVKNVILYSPKGTATIGHNTTDQPNQGGIARRTMNNTESTIENCIVAGYQIGNRDSGLTGGLVGHHLAGKLIIKNCAAVNTLQGTSVGGLVGLSDTLGQTATISELEIIDSYAGDSITYAKSNAGGLVGSNIAGNRDYQNGNVSYKGNVYSYVDISGTESTATVYGIGPGTVAASSTAKYWQNGLPSGVIAKDTDTNIKAVSLADLTITPSTNLRTYRPDTDTSHGDDVRFKNGLTESTEDYPFTPVVNVPATVYGETGADIPVHYGDWPDEPAAGSLCYYDVVNGAYGVWGYIDPAKPIVNTLAKGDLTDSDLEFATQDGYCVLVEDNGAEPTLSGVTGATIDPSPIDVNIDGKDYNLYKIKIDTSFTSTGYYTKITVDTTDYWFNPYFACEVLTEEPKDTSGDPALDMPQAKKAVGSTDGINYVDVVKNTVVIRTARQLANLASQTGPEVKDNNVQNRSYVQLLDIDFEKYTMDGFKTGKESENTSWEPMALNNGGYNGKEFVISNLYIKNNSDESGLFGNTKGKLENIRLKNVKVEGKKYVGALAGRFRGDTITNCGVYTDSANYESCAVTGSGERVGGLIGSLNSQAGATLTSCFAAVRVEGEDDYVGGLVGYIAATNNDTTLVNCYSGGHTNSGKYKLDSDGKANVTGERYVGGLIGGVAGTSNTVKLSGVNYSTCSVKKTGTNDYIGLLAGRDDNSVKIDSTTSTTSTAYATGKAFDMNGEITPREEHGYLKPAMPVTSSTVTAHPYDTLTGPYPYDSGLKDHYGDWPAATVEATGIAYVEIENGVVHIHLVGVYPDGRIVQYNDLCVDRHEMEMTGHEITKSYFATFAVDGSIPSGLSNPSNLQKVTSTDTDASNAINTLKSLLGGTATVELYINNSSNSTYEFGCDVNGKYVHYAPRYSNVGASASNSDMFGNENRPFDIRTVEQLDNLPNSQNKYFKLSHDLYGGGYTKNFDGGSFSGKLDGGGYRILELSMTGGLFQNTTSDAVIKNLILYSPSGNANITPSTGSNAYAGGLVQEVNGRTTIENCIVAGYKLSGRHVGGLVAKSSGELTITNCAAVNNLTSDKGNGNAGGLIGNYQSGTCTIKNSYAGGSIIGQTGNENIGGLYGGNSSSHPTLENCYSYVDLTNTKGTVNTLGNGASGNNIYYLENTLPTGGGNVTDNEQGTKQTAEQLKSCMKGVKDSKGNLIFGTADEAHTFHSSATLTGAFPFPAIVQVDGHFVHYGDWPTP